jgi:hypothetical protein
MALALPLPALDVSSVLLPFVAIAVPMVVLTVAVLGLLRPSDGRPPLITQLVLALTLVSGGSLLLLALLFVFLDSNGTTAWTWVLLAFNFMMITPVGLWFVGHLVFRDRRPAPGDWTWPVALGVSITGSEILMGLLFAVGAAHGAVTSSRAAALGLSSIWFFWSMASLMAPLILWAPLAPVARAGGWALVAAAVAAPWVPPYPLLGGIAMAAVMGGVFAAILRELGRGGVSGSESGLLIGLGAAFLGMAAAGLGVALGQGSAASLLAFGTLMALVMVAEVSYLIRHAYAMGAAPATPARTVEPVPTLEPRGSSSGSSAGP